MQLDPLVTIIILSIFGAIVKFVPAFKSWPIRLIPWLKLALAYLIQIFAPTTAHAGFFDYLGAGAGWVATVVWPPLQVIISRAIYEAFVKPAVNTAGIVGNPPVTPLKVVRHAKPAARSRSRRR